MSLFDTMKSDAQKNVEGLLGDMFDYQTQKLLNAPVLARLSGNEPSGNLTAEQIAQGQRGATSGIPSGNSNGDLSNSLGSPMGVKWYYWLGGALAIILLIVLVKRR